MSRPAACILVPRLMKEFGYPENGARLVADDLVGCSDAIWDIFWDWWQGGELRPYSVEGYSASDLMSERGMNPIAALLSLDWLIREPEQAKESLRKGHDRVT